MCLCVYVCVCACVCVCVCGCVCVCVCVICRVGQSLICTVNIRYLGQGNHQIYCVYLRFCPSLVICYTQCQRVGNQLLQFGNQLLQVGNQLLQVGNQLLQLCAFSFHVKRCLKGQSDRCHFCTTCDSYIHVTSAAELVSKQLHCSVGASTAVWCEQ